MTKHTLLLIGILAPAILVASGCILRATPLLPRAQIRVQAQVPQPQAVQVQVAAPQAGVGVVIVESNCTPGAAEACNGLDDNCNGQIDEGCGYSSGHIQITAHWDTGADIDLYVHDPANERIFYGHRSAASGGQLDHDARGACNRGQNNNRIENVFWNTPNPPPGDYRVELHYWNGSCSSNQGPTTATVSIAIGGQVVGVYRHTLNPDQRTAVANFRLP
jgi:tRNA (guanosine-2'-O-)-methyltransferase